MQASMLMSVPYGPDMSIEALHKIYKYVVFDHHFRRKVYVI